MLRLLAMKNVWNKKGIKVLAPMAGYTDAAFRLLCREQGADLVVTELISADAIAFNKFKVESLKSKVLVRSGTNKSTAEMLSFYMAEKPLIIQLFGKYPEKFAKAARWIDENLPVDGIDINMGCPARKVVGSDHGAALLKNPLLAKEIVEAVKANTKLPVSVKTRLGWSNDQEILEFAPVLASAGISAITVHGRTYKDGFGGEARWENIYRVKELLGEKVAVIGNGDVTTASLKSKVDSLKLDGVAVGRAAFGNPWIFKESKVKSQKSNEEANFELSFDEWANTVIRHAQLSYEMKGEHGLVEFRKHLLAYLKGFPDAKSLRMSAVRISSVEDVENIVLSAQKLKQLN